MIYAAIAIALFSLAVLIVALRGRRIDDHPICRCCRFDLVGIHGREPKCPECGAELAAARAVRIGQRRWRPVMATFGAGLLLLAIGGGIYTSGGTRWQEHKPMRLLYAETIWGGPDTEGAALKEVMRRICGGAASQESLGRFVELALQRQADLLRPWDVRLGDLVQEAKLRGLIRHEDWIRFADQTIQATMTPRAAIVVGDATPFTIHWDIRSGQGPLLLGRADLAGVEPSGQGAQEEEPGKDKGSSTNSAPSWGQSFVFNGILTRGTNWSLEPPLRDPLMAMTIWPRTATTGEAELRVDLDIVLGENPSYPNMEMNLLRTLDAPLVSKRLTLRAPLRVVTEDEAPIGLIKGEAVRAELLAALSPPQLRIQGNTDRVQLYTMITLQPVQVPVAYDIYWRSGESEWFAGSTSTEPQPRSRNLHAMRTVDPIAPDTVDLILRPSTAAARRTPNLVAICGEEIIFKDIAVQKQIFQLPPR